MAEMRELGYFWPGEFIAPIIAAPKPWGTPWGTPIIFCGSSTLLGRDWLLSAKHVLRDAFAIEDHTPMAVKLAIEEHQVRFIATQITEYEPHPTQDLAFARMIEWDAKCFWDGWGVAAPLDDVQCVGYPYQEVGAIQSGDFTAINNPRYVKGYVTRGMELPPDPMFGDRLLELSFDVPKGMSGSPVWGYSRSAPPGWERPIPPRILIGIAVGVRKGDFLRSVEVLEERDDGSKLIERTVTRNDAGIAIRLNGVLDWPISLLDGAHLGELVPNDGSGQFPEQLSGPGRTLEEVLREQAEAEHDRETG